MTILTSCFLSVGACVALSGGGISAFVAPPLVVYVQDQGDRKVAACDPSVTQDPTAFAQEKCPCDRGSVGLQFGVPAACWTPYQWPLGDERDCVTITIAGLDKKPGSCSEGEIQVDPWLDCCFGVSGTIVVSSCCTAAPCNAGLVGGVQVPIYCCWGNTVSISNDPDCQGVGGGAAPAGGPGAHAFRSRLFAVCVKADVEQTLDIRIGCSVAAWPQYGNGLATIRTKVKCKCPLK